VIRGDGSDFGPREVAAEIASTAAASTGSTRLEPGIAPVLTAPVAAVFPAPGTGTPVGPVAAGGGGAVATGITTPSVAPSVTTATPAATRCSAPASPSPAAGFGLVDTQRSPHQLCPLEAVDGLVFHLGIGHFHEGEAPLATRVPLQGQGAVHHLPVGSKQLNDVFLLGAEGEITDKDAH
jgi:hypothetical protein